MAIVDRLKLLTSNNSHIAIAGGTIIVPAGAPQTAKASGVPEVVAYSVP